MATTTTTPNETTSKAALDDVQTESMVFTATQDIQKAPEPKKSGQKSSVKNVSAKLKGRKDTPAPLTKEGGRKRFVSSPFGDDKQIRNKIDFGSESPKELDPLKSESECRVAIFGVGKDSAFVPIQSKTPSSSGLGAKVTMESLAGVKEAAAGGTTLDKTSSPTGNREERTVGADKADTKYQTFAEVNLLHSAMNTASERQIVPFTNETSRDCIESENHVQPDYSLLRLANPFSAEELDRDTSQPLLVSDHWRPSRWPNPKPSLLTWRSRVVPLKWERKHLRWRSSWPL